MRLGLEVGFGRLGGLLLGLVGAFGPQAVYLRLFGSHTLVSTPSILSSRYPSEHGMTRYRDVLPEDLVLAAEAIDPKYLEAPTEVYGPSLSSLERYALEQEPAPPKAE